jgi:Thioredoxin-like
MKTFSFFLALCCILLLAEVSRAGVDEDWAAIAALDAGPGKKPTSMDDARQLARAHLSRQQTALEAFLARYPKDAHAFDARARLAAVWATEGAMDGDQAQVDKALRTLADLEKTPDAPFEKRADVGFLRVSVFMQSKNTPGGGGRDAIVLAARNYAAMYPGDRRGPRLLVEAATLCDDTPKLKRDLLNQALATTREEPLKQRIADDFKRLDQLGKPLSLHLTSVRGPDVDLAALRGKVVVLVFWAASSPHSLIWLRDFYIACSDLPQDQLRVVTVSVDDDRAELDKRLPLLPPNWPVQFDGKGWQGSVVRSLGINALPSVWILDKKGVVCTINGKENYQTWIRQLLRE